MIRSGNHSYSSRVTMGIAAGLVVVVVLCSITLFARTLPQLADMLQGDLSKPDTVPFIAPKLPDGRQRAFPTAEGFGAAAKGGRGGRVIFVDTLADSGRGSLRACIEASGPRTCIFRRSGLITLKTASLVVRNPYLTIAGETAPGDGIALRNSPLQLRPSLEISTHDVIVRFIRIRPGPHPVAACCSGALGFYGTVSTDIIVDHVSASWGSDETIDSENARNVTVQWSFVTEPLLNGGPGKHDRARNMYMTKGGNFSIHHNLFALGKFRNPQFQTSGHDDIEDVVNNVLYSPVWDYVISFSDRWGPVRANVVGNYKITGVDQDDDRLVHLFNDGGHGFSIFLRDNFDEKYIPDETVAVDEALEEKMRRFVVPTAFATPSIQTSTAKEAYEKVLDSAGATRPKRDVVDRRVVEDVRSRSGDLLRTKPQDVGGWPVLKSAVPPADDDEDGMPNTWERKVGLNAENPSDGQEDRNGDGWTNLEEYLHVLAGDGYDVSGAVGSAG